MTTGFLKDRIGNYIQQDPQATLDYTIDWGEWIAVNNVVVTSSWGIESIENDNTPMTTSSNGFDPLLSTTYIVLSGGTVGNHYRITNTITTSNNLTEERYFRIFIRDRSA